MTSPKTRLFRHAMVWIDHQQARIFRYDLEPDAQSSQVIRAADAPVHLHHKANERANGHVPVDHPYLEHVAQALIGASLILIAGPAGAKHELLKHIGDKHPALLRNIAGVETVDHPTDGEFVNFARTFFQKADRMASPDVSMSAS